ncbi:MAG: BrnT family toxin [Acidobacteriota bacterium]|nr:BrnT family toxin [Acidobacteriota bacterium]
MEPKLYAWNEEKNQRLKAERDVSFEEVVFNIADGNILDIVRHPNQEKYKGQRIFIVNINDYAYLVPFVETESEIFLKTIIPNRKATRKYLGGKRGK